MCTGILRNTMRLFIFPSSHLTILSECLGHKVEHACSTAVVQSSFTTPPHRFNLATPSCTFPHCSSASCTQGLHVPCLVRWASSNLLIVFSALFAFSHNASTTTPAQYLPGWNCFLLFVKCFHFIVLRSAPKTQELRATQNSMNC